VLRFHYLQYNDNTATPTNHIEMSSFEVDLLTTDSSNARSGLITLRYDEGEYLYWPMILINMIGISTERSKYKYKFHCLLLILWGFLIVVVSITLYEYILHKGNKYIFVITNHIW
jgi:hypothetical protein